MAETPYAETEALLRSLREQDAEDADGEDELGDDTLAAYLLENFLPGELLRLARACDRLKREARDVRARMILRGDGEVGP